MEERGTRKDMPMKPQVVTHTLNKLLKDDAIVSSDSGTIATWTARYVDIRGTMQFSLSGSLATMANGLPYSIGAAVAYPGRQVVCVVGDGGLTMLMGEIATLVKYKLQVCVIVIKNNVLGQIKWEQMILEGNPEFGVELEPIDFARLPKRAEPRGFTIERPEEAEQVLREALSAQRARRSCRRSSIPTSRRCRARSPPSRHSTSPKPWCAGRRMRRRSSRRSSKIKIREVI